MADIDKKDRAFEELVGHVSALIDKSRERVKTFVNTTMVYTNYGIGYYIVEFEQHGHSRAAYGKETLNKLSRRLTDKYGDGWSVDQLERFRKFFLIYSNSATVLRNSENCKIRDTVADFVESDLDKIVDTVYQIPMPSFSDVL